MTWNKKVDFSNIPWFTLAMTGIFILSLMLRFWNLNQFNTLVFDEVYYAKFSNDYLTGTPFFNAHPPLSQYLIAIGIWIGSHFPTAPDTVNGLTGSLRSTFSYRWLNAFSGSFIPLIVGAIAYQLTRRRSYGLIAALFAALDGLFLVESRYALNNIYLVIFGLLGQLYFLLALKDNKRWNWQLTLSGIFFGASAAIKWNGLGFLLGIYLISIVAWLTSFGKKEKDNISQSFQIPLQNITRLTWLPVVCNLGIVPIITYSLLWIPHLLMNSQYGFWEIQKEILSFHERIGDGSKVHPYCSHWYSWLLMWRPIAYFYQKVLNTEATVPAYPPLPEGAGKVIYDVHAMGNPILWWLSTAAIVLLLLLLISRIFSGEIVKYAPTAQTWIALYIISNYVANLLPWVKVTRCTFLYHYMPSYVFAWLALTWIIDGWLRSHVPAHRNAGIAVILLVTAAFIFWLPIYLGIPLSPEGYRIRMWFPNWI